MPPQEKRRSGRASTARKAPVGRTPARASHERKPREERWPELLGVATEAFYERGYEGASLQDIAARLGMLKGSLYYYIHNKDDLLFEVVSSVYEPGLKVVQDAAQTSGDPLERLEKVINAHVEYTCRNLLATAVYLHELKSLPANLRRKVDGRSYEKVFVDLLEQAQQAGLLRPGVTPKLSMFWILGSTNWVYRWFQPNGEFAAPEIATKFADLAIRAIASEPVLVARDAAANRAH